MMLGSFEIYILAEKEEIWELIGRIEIFLIKILKLKEKKNLSDLNYEISFSIFKVKGQQQKTEYDLQELELREMTKLPFYLSNLLIIC